MLLLTTFSDDEYIIKALSLGAKGYILKQNFECIAPAVNAVFNGQTVFGEEIIEKLPNSLTGDVIYPVAPLKSDDISDVEFNASNEFIKFMSEEKAVKLFEKYHFSMS